MENESCTHLTSNSLMFPSLSFYFTLSFILRKCSFNFWRWLQVRNIFFFIFLFLRVNAMWIKYNNWYTKSMSHYRYSALIVQHRDRITLCKHFRLDLVGPDGSCHTLDGHGTKEHVAWQASSRMTKTWMSKEKTSLEGKDKDLSDLCFYKIDPCVLFMCLQDIISVLFDYL